LSASAFIGTNRIIPAAIGWAGVNLLGAVTAHGSETGLELVPEFHLLNDLSSDRLDLKSGVCDNLRGVLAARVIKTTLNVGSPAIVDNGLSLDLGALDLLGKQFVNLGPLGFDIRDGPLPVVFTALLAVRASLQGGTVRVIDISDDAVKHGLAVVLQD
jgi:hypothetical protein